MSKLKYLIPLIIWTIIGTIVFIWGAIIFETPVWLIYFTFEDGGGIFINTLLWIVCAPVGFIIAAVLLYIVMWAGDIQGLFK